MKKKIPKFGKENDEADFWAEQDSTEYIDWSKAEKWVLPNLKPSVKTISLRLPASMLADLKVPASQRDVPCQSLLKIFLAEKDGEGAGLNVARVNHMGEAAWAISERRHGVKRDETPRSRAVSTST